MIHFYMFFLIRKQVSIVVLIINISSYELNSTKTRISLLAQAL